MTDTSTRDAGYVGRPDASPWRDDASAWLETRDRRFIERLPAPTLLMDLDRMTVVVINEEFQRMLGYDEAETRAMGEHLVARLVHPDEQPMLVEKFASLFAARDGEVVESEFRSRHADGRWRWIRTRNSVFCRHPDGRARSMLTVALDDNDRIEAFAEVERSARRLTEAQRVGHVGSWEWDPATGRLDWTPEMFRIWGIDPADGAPEYGRFMGTIPEPDRSNTEALLGRVLAGSEVRFRVDHRLNTPDGSVLHIQCRGEVHRDAGGQPLRVTGSSQDVTELLRALDAVKASEERYRLAAAVTTDVLYDYGVASERIHWNPAMTQTFGHSLETEESTSVDWWLMHVHPEDRARVQASVRGAMTSGADRWGDEYRFRRADGQYALVLDRAHVMRDAEGVATRLIGSMQDETARRALEARVRQTTTLDALGTLAGGIAHDFNNILTGILGFAELAELDVPRTSEAGESVAKIIEAAQRARALVQRILAFSRRDDATREPVLLQELVDDTLPLLRASLPSSLHIECTVARDVPLVTEGDRLVFQQGLVNLCVNAEHATRQVPAPLLLLSLSSETIGADEGTRRALRPGRYARLSVRDNGVGMPPHVAERIFEPFFTTKPVGEGTGLGLALVHGAVSAAGGTVDVASAPGLGTEVAILLPVRD